MNGREQYMVHGEPVVSAAVEGRLVAQELEPCQT